MKSKTPPKPCTQRGHWPNSRQDARAHGTTREDPPTAFQSTVSIVQQRLAGRPEPGASKDGPSRRRSHLHLQKNRRWQQGRVEDSVTLQSPGGTSCTAYRTFCHPEDNPKNTLCFCSERGLPGACREVLHAEASEAPSSLVMQITKATINNSALRRFKEMTRGQLGVR